MSLLVRGISTAWLAVAMDLAATSSATVTLWPGHAPQGSISRACTSMTRRCNPTTTRLNILLPWHML